jgi:hypothetical protein
MSYGFVPINSRLRFYHLHKEQLPVANGVSDQWGILLLVLN